ncbi:15565_t:CDS:1 [Dentiscutata erythropus]|uniref:15565_t:CDS:1 n=1 Tax=Dentiscutata erythropus TaxID=1348616 RepID=A0A9N9D8M7_9GLOM|nr:15565_t:CDS:1 [Dentiscutata erythropus]
MPTVNEIIDRLKELLDFGFKPTNTAILNILQSFESRLDLIGKKIIYSFISIRKNENRDEFYKKIVTEVIKPECHIEKFDVLNFLDENIGSESGLIFLDVMRKFKERTSSYASPIPIDYMQINL